MEKRFQQDSTVLNNIAQVENSYLQAGQPMALFTAIDNAYRELVGHKAITLFSCNNRTGDVVRLYTGGQLTGHPPGEKKNMASTPWGKQVLEEKQIFIVHTQQEFDCCFPTQSSDVSKSNCPSTLTYPVVYSGSCIGAINLLHEEHYFTDERIDTGRYIAPLLLPALISRCGH